MADGSGFPADAGAARFKEAMSRWATGVAIATCWGEGAPHGLAISSFTSVSVAPPRVLFCLAKAGRSAPAFRAAVDVGINVLSSGAEALARRFSGGEARETRFEPIVWDLSPDAPPRLHDALVHIRGGVRARLDAGSHEVLVIDVLDASTGYGRPLIYAARDYRQLAEPPVS